MSEAVRILDLGASDGYVSLWLARQLRERGVEVRVDAIELHPDAVEVARRRLAAEAIEGSVVRGNALDVADYFDPGTYDAVICFELIEHVPDPDALLEAAERMVKLNGRVYVSTPDGTFGEGHNPNHLRVLRATDLADVLRRRGRLADMQVGSDRVTVASYTPTPRRGDVAIYCGPGWEPWSPLDIERKGLGGSETAAVRLAEQLSELGYVVTVYAEVEQCSFRDVIFRHHSVFDPLERRDALICSRIPEIADRPLNARVRLLWLHDTDPGDRLTTQRAEPFDHVLCLSRWHRDHLAGMYPFIRGKLRQIRNGITHAYFRLGDEPERRRRVVYTSSPDRGLDYLLEWWPEIRGQVPDAEFAFAYSDVYNRVAQSDPVIAKHRQRCAELLEGLEGVKRLGSLTQPQVANLMRASLVWAHPSWSTPADSPFYETSCIGAMEAQAAGCVVVASDWGALSETVRTGRLVGTQRWAESFVEEIVDGLTSEKTQAWAQQEGPKAVADLGWDGVAHQVAGLIDGEAFAFGPDPEDASVA